MSQTKKALDEVRIPFTKMSFHPDVPSTALGPDEYNSGLNIETDVRGIRSISGDQEILPFPVPGTPTFISGGFRTDENFWFIVATVEGNWYASNGINSGVSNDGDWQDITPPGLVTTNYSQSINITEAWNGTVPFFNDTENAPMFWPEPTDLDPAPILSLYTNNIPVKDILNIVTIDAITQQIQINGTYDTAPFAGGEKILIQGVNNFFNGIYTVVGSTTTTIDYLAQPGAAYPGTADGQQVAAAYTWNYNPNWKFLTAEFMRLYNTPNVGSILVAGGLTATNLDDTVDVFPVTVQWSQAFGLNAAPLTWQPTITNVANQLEVPLRGPAVDAFPCNGQFFLCSYWDTVVFSPINYSTTSAPILGVRLMNQGRGLLTSNAWANTDKLIYGVDARDIWVFNGQDFQGLGNQRVKNWFYDQLHPDHVDQLFMQTNTQKNQIEIYYTSKDFDTETNPQGIPNKMLSYRYDLEIWNAPRDVSEATFATESPDYNYDSGTNTWSFNKGSRTVVYARGIEDQKIVQKDVGYSWADGTAIDSYFRRDNIKMLPDYSGKLLVHRILPEVINIKDSGVPIDPAVDTSLIGSVGIQIEGANSVGQAPVSTQVITVDTDTDEPWAQISQNAHRVNSIEISNSSNTNIWLCSATTWQFTQTEDDR